MQGIAILITLFGFTLAQDDKQATVAPVVPSAYNPGLFPGYFPGQQRYYPGSPYYTPAVAGAYNPAVAGAYNPYFPRSPYRYNQTVPSARIPPVPTVAGTARPGILVPGAGAAIISKVEELNPDGSFNYAYETENGIVAQASGSVKNAGLEGQEAQTMQGTFSYTSPEGVPITVTWYADETGFHAEGQHLPRQPVVPLVDLPLASQATRPN